MRPTSSHPPSFTESDCVYRERIYYVDTDAGGVVYYANYLAYLEKARTEWMRSRGLDVAALAGQGLLFVVSSVAVSYRSPARYGDTVKVYAILSRLTPVRMYFDYRITRESSDTLIAEAQTVMVSIGADFKPVSLPDAIFSVFSHGRTS